MTDRDIEGNVLAIVGAFIEGQKLQDTIMRERDPAKRDAFKKQSEDCQKVAVECATKLVTTLLVDIHRIADALEHRSKTFPDVG